MHTIASGQWTSYCDLLLPEEEPLHAQRRSALHRLTAMDSKRPKALAPLDAKLEHTFRRLAESAAKRQWLQAVLYREDDDKDEGDEGGEGGEGAGDTTAAEDEPVNVNVNGSSGSVAADAPAATSAMAAAAAAAGRQLRSLPSFASALLDSNVHAARHALRPRMLSTPSLPPPLPAEDDEPPAPNAVPRAFDGPWMAFAIKAYLADTQRRRRQAPAQ